VIIKLCKPRRRLSDFELVEVARKATAFHDDVEKNLRAEMREAHLPSLAITAPQFPDPSFVHKSSQTVDRFGQASLPNNVVDGRSTSEEVELNPSTIPMFRHTLEMQTKYTATLILEFVRLNPRPTVTFKRLVQHCQTVLRDFGSAL
jgi:hypothetical protein